MILGYARPINHGVGIIFAVSWAILSYYQKYSPQHLSSAIKSIVGFLNGTEGKPNLLEKKLSKNRLVIEAQGMDYDIITMLVVSLYIKISAEGICPHTKHGSKCEIHWMSSFAQSFVFGYGLKVYSFVREI